VPPSIAKTTATKEGYGYRAVKLCSEVNDLLKLRERILKRHPGSQDIAHFEDELLKKCDLVGDQKTKIYSDYLDIEDLTRGDFSPSECRWRARRNLKRMNAAYLYRAWYLNGSAVKGEPLFCTDNRFYGPLVVNPDQESLYMKFIDNTSCGRDFTSISCKDARRVLSTWEIDFPWTEAQHAVGADFAIRNCKKLKSDDEIYKNACTIDSSTIDSSEHAPAPGNK
jgi:hypothetical protein